MRLWELEDHNRAVLKHSLLSERGFRQDNPGGEWLENKQRNAARDQALGRRDMLQGPCTGYFEKPLLVSATWLHQMPGAMGENHRPGTPKFDALLKDVEENGGFDMSPRRAGLAGVNHVGDAYVLEGNTRAAVAVHLGIDLIPFEIKYWNGGELVRGHYDPLTAAQMSEVNTNPR